MSCLFGCAPAAEESSTGSQTQEQSPAADQSSASGGTDAAASDVPYAKLGTMDISATGKINVSVVENVDYIAANMPNGGEFILEIDSLTDPESMISNIEKLIAAGCNGLTVCAVNDAMLIKVAQLCEEAGVYWAVIYREIIDEEVREVSTIPPTSSGRSCGSTREPAMTSQKRWRIRA